MKQNKLKPSITKELRNKTILVTGGAGSVGSSLVKKLLEYPVKSVRVLDYNENELFKLKRTIHDDRLRFLFGNILDKDRVEMACNGVDIIIHAAAIKNIEISEFNPIETIDVNVNGIINLIQIAMKYKIKKFLNISTDKAAAASTLYGNTKQLGERLVSWAGMHSDVVKFGSLRFGNVIETKGNVFEVWNEQVKENIPLSITDPTMKRYFFHIDEAIDFVLKCLSLINFGEICIPKMKLHTIGDLANEISKKQKIIGVRQGEKFEEILITEEERKNASELKDMWIVQTYDKIRTKTKFQKIQK
jgi:UDP-N-acetylglucosamine 4,6-dehydratase/5-epimerase